VRAPFAQVQRSGRYSARVQRDPRRIGRWYEQLGRDIGEQQLERIIRGEQVVMTVDNQRGIRLVCAQKTVDRLADGSISGASNERSA
jgi:hypothetical protein